MNVSRLELILQSLPFAIHVYLENLDTDDLYGTLTQIVLFPSLCIQLL